jgi:hypothetical protein
LRACGPNQPECARPRAQQRSSTETLQKLSKPSSVFTFLRPRTGALRFGQQAFDTASGTPVSDPAGRENRPETRRIGDQRSAIPAAAGQCQDAPTTTELRLPARDACDWLGVFNRLVL